MKTYPYYKLNAFTIGNSEGNLAAFLDLGTDPLSEDAMLAIAKEHSGFVSEVVYVNRDDTGSILLTYYLLGMRSCLLRPRHHRHHV